MTITDIEHIRQEEYMQAVREYMAESGFTIDPAPHGDGVIREVRMGERQ